MNFDADVTIIGCGPVGATLANLLGRRGVSVNVVEKQSEPYGLPRAIHFDGEVMRVFQATGLSREIAPHTLVGKGMHFRDRNGEMIVDWSRRQDLGPMGWYESYRFHQPGLEVALIEGFARFSNVTLHREKTVVDIDQDTLSATVKFEDGCEVTSKYVVGCDGAGSLTRRLMNAKWRDLGFKERWLVVDAQLSGSAGDLGDHTIQFCDAEDPATYVRGIGSRRRWELRLRDNAPKEPDETTVWSLLSRWITPDDAALERSAVYTFQSRIASKWRNGRVFIAGDAAHQMPPFMGQGMCAGIRDASNLAWKLKMALDNEDDQLLNTYQSERDSHVQGYIDLSVRLGRLINQSSANAVRNGRMKSIWPPLGIGFGSRDSIGGRLVPQVLMADGTLSDDAAKNSFHVIAKPEHRRPGIISGLKNWLNEKDVAAVLVRPDGYGVRACNADEIDALVDEAQRLNRRQRLVC